MGLSDWIGIFAIITFVGFAGMFYEVATQVPEIVRRPKTLAPNHQRSFRRWSLQNEPT
jgi:hypothetical protein